MTLAPGPYADQPVSMIVGVVVGFTLTTALLFTLSHLDIDVPPLTSLLSLWATQRWTQRRLQEALERADLEIAMRSDASV